MNKNKFIGWKQLLIVSIVTGMTAQYGSAAVSLSNTIMRSGMQIAMTATAFGIGSTIYSLMQGPPQILVGAWIKKQGTSKVFLIGIPFYIIVTFGVTRLLNNDISYILIYGVLWGLSFMLTSQIATQTMVNNWFIQRRGEAMNFMLAITTIFSFMSPYIVQWAIMGVGKGNFRYGWYSIGVLGILSFPLVFLLKDKPEDIGQYPDGVEPGKVIETKKSGAVSTIHKVEANAPIITVKEAMTKPVFWFIMICAGLGFAISMVAFALASVHFVDKGFEISIITGAMAWRNIARFVFLILIAKISDRIEPGYLLGLSFLACGIVTLMAANPSSSAIVYSYFSIAMVMSAALNTSLATMIANIFGRKSFPTLQGICLTAGGLISATTGTIGGLIADFNNGSYTLAFILYGIVCIIACVISVFGIGIPCAQKYKSEHIASN